MYILQNHVTPKICIIEVHLLKYYFESHLIYKYCYCRQTSFNINVDMIGLCHSVAILWEIYVMQHKCNERWLTALPFQANANYGTWSIDFGHSLFLYLKPMVWFFFVIPAYGIKSIHCPLIGKGTQPIMIKWSDFQPIVKSLLQN